MSILEAAEKILKEAGGPLGVDELTRTMVDCRFKDVQMLGLNGGSNGTYPIGNELRRLGE